MLSKDASSTISKVFGKTQPRAQGYLKMESKNVFRNRILICLYKHDLALNKLQWMICYKTQIIYIE